MRPLRNMRRAVGKAIVNPFRSQVEHHSPAESRQAQRRAPGSVAMTSARSALRPVICGRGDVNAMSAPHLEHTMAACRLRDEPRFSRYRSNQVMNVPSWTKPAVWGVVGGGLATAIVGFSYLGWSTAATADRMA